jgi:hypothetical protein
VAITLGGGALCHCAAVTKQVDTLASKTKAGRERKFDIGPSQWHRKGPVRDQRHTVGEGSTECVIWSKKDDLCDNGAKGVS